MTDIEYLLNSCVYQTSLASKELFHSNLWAWLMNKDFVFVKVFFPDVNPKDVCKVRREERNRDITIHLNDSSILIIENKIKSLPEEKQLNEYQNDCESKLINGCLTGLVPTLPLTKFPKWSFLSYRQIGQRILMYLSKADNLTAFEIEYINEYVEVITKLSNVVEDSLDTEYLHLKNDDTKKIKFDDVMQKFVANKFCNYLEENLNIPNNVDGLELKIFSYFYNKKAIIDVRYCKDDLFIIGIQIEGSQYRFLAQRNESNLLDEVYDCFAKYNWFDDVYDKNKKLRMLFGKKTTMKPLHNRKYNKYEDKYSCVYQYYDITNDSFDALLSIIKEDMLKAVEIINKIKVDSTLWINKPIDSTKAK